MKNFILTFAVSTALATMSHASNLDFSHGATPTNSGAIVVSEGEDVAVAAGDLAVDYLVGGNLIAGQTVSGVSTYVSGTDLPTGSYDSFLVHFDPDVNSETTQTVSFTGDIIALIVSNGSPNDPSAPSLLNLSDAIFGGNNTYETVLSRRSEDTDMFTLVDANTLTFSFITHRNYVDNIRVITTTTPAPVPVPASLPLLLTALGSGVALRRLRRKA